MTTLIEVARRARVSPMTASRVVNGASSVSPTLRERVERAVAETGYMPNTVARNLRSRRTDTIALLLPDMTNPFFTTLANGVETAARTAGMSMILANSDERAEEEERLVRAILQRQVDGLLLVPADDGSATVRLCRDHGIHAVIVDRRPVDSGTDVVRADVEGGAHALGSLLVALGHRRMAVLTGPASVPTAMDRVAGFRRAVVDDAGQPEPLVIHGAFRIESGRDMALTALRATPRPTALFAANNFIAIGVMHALDALGLRVPEDVAIVGFDDLPAAMITFPFFTVAAQPAFEMGQRAVAVLLERAANPDAPAQDVVLPTELVIRRSSGDPVRATARP